MQQGGANEAFETRFGTRLAPKDTEGDKLNVFARNKYFPYEWNI